MYLREEAYVTADKVERCLQEAFFSTESGMHLIKAQMGLGKTGEYVKLATDHSIDRFLIALPMNRLKEEIKKRLLDNGVPERDIFMMASVHSNAFIPAEI